MISVSDGISYLRNDEILKISVPQIGLSNAGHALALDFMKHTIVPDAKAPPPEFRGGQDLEYARHFRLSLSIG